MNKLKIKNKIELGKMEMIDQELGHVKTTYLQSRFALHEMLASGVINGKKYEVHHSFDRVYVTFLKLKGELPNIGVNVRDLVEAAYKSAKENKLL